MKQAMNNIFEKYLTKKVRNIISIFIIIFGLVYVIDYSFYKPTYINKYIANNIYKDAANSNFADSAFYNCVIDSYNDEKDTHVAYTTSLTNNQLSSMKVLTCRDYDISSVEGLRLMSNLEDITFDGVRLSTIDFSRQTNLKNLTLVTDYDLVELDLSHNTKLERLYVLNADFTDIGTLDLSANTNLEYIIIEESSLRDLNVGNNTHLRSLQLFDNDLATLDLRGATNIEFLNVANNNFNGQESINLTGISSLISFGVENTLDINDNPKGTNSFDTLDLSAFPDLEYFSAGYNGIGQLNLKGNPNLTFISAGHNNLTTIDFSKNTKLKSIYISDNELTSLGLTKNVELSVLYAENNDLSSINLSKNTELEYIRLAGNDFRNTMTRYVGDTGTANSAVILPADFDDDLMWESNDEDIAVSDIEGHVSTVSEGQTDIIGTSSYYTTRTHVNSFKARSENYDVGSGGNSIFVGTETDMNAVINNIEISDFIAASIRVKLGDDGNSIVLEKNDTVLKTMQIIRVRVYNSYKDVMKFGDGYVYSGTFSDPRDMFECINCTASVSNGRLSIGYVSGDSAYNHNFKIIYISTNYTVYGAEGGFVYAGTDNNAEVLSNFKAINGNTVINDEESKLEVRTSSNELLDSFKLKRVIVDEAYVTGSNYIFTGFNEFDITKVSHLFGVA